MKGKTVNARTLVEKFAAEQGWNDDSIISILVDFIDGSKRVAQLERYLKDRQTEEDEMGSSNADV